MINNLELPKLRITAIISLLVVLSCKIDSSKNHSFVNYYYPLINKAEIEYRKKNFDEAYEIYSEAFKDFDPLDIGSSRETINYALVCSELGFKKEAIEYFKRSALKGYDVKYYTNRNEYKEVFESEEGKVLINQLDSLRGVYLKGINIPLRNKIQELITIDQLNNMTARQDSTFIAHGYHLKEIIENHGYPNQNLIGNFNIDFTHSDPIILLLHTEDSIRKTYFIPKLKEQVLLGKCPPITLATVIDNFELSNGNPQVYGTYRVRDTLRATLPLNKINQNRQKIGLRSLAEQKLRDSLLRASQ